MCGIRGENAETPALAAANAGASYSPSVDGSDLADLEGLGTLAARTDLEFDLLTFVE